MLCKIYESVEWIQLAQNRIQGGALGPVWNFRF